MYISENSGHHRACLALANALRMLDKRVETRCINSFQYTNPVLEKIINKTYMTVIKRKPQVWEYLYDNPNVVKKSQRLKETIHKLNSGKMLSLLDAYKPSAIVCTQAFPCGIIADLKKSCNLSVPLFGILTDYAPHSYWIYNDVNAYIVPSEETGARLVENGVSEERIKPLGIPVDPKFYKKPDKDAVFAKYSLDKKIPVILIMGGGQGLGPISKLVSLLLKSPINMQIIVVTGINKKLYKNLNRKKETFKKKMVVLPFSENVDELMEISTVILTKPGGITIAESLSKRLPMIIINPLPGQETMNTRFLINNRLGIKANDALDAAILLEELLANREKLENIKKAVALHSKTNASLKIAGLVLKMAS